jgi:two-component system repressor protein LuxO
MALARSVPGDRAAAATGGRARALLVEDTASLAHVYAEYLARAGCAVEMVGSSAAAREALAREVPEVMLLDVQLPDGNGLELLRHVKAQQMPVEVIVITAHGSINTAVEAMRDGAFDFLVKPFNADRLSVTVRNALERRRLTGLVETWRESFARDSFCGFIGASLPMQAVYRIIESAAASKATVFVTGESGTGKEVCADAIHRMSPRRDKPFVALNCAAMPGELIESEMFGHVKGAFTGAHADRAGAAIQANAGTLFLDEICEMDLGLQSKLLRFLQTGVVQRIGSTRPEPVDVRIVCATNRDPRAEVAAGRFREDLFYRLHVIPIHLPALREREDDMLLIAKALLAKFAAEEHKKFRDFATDAEALLRAHPWPGNVRELQNVLRNAIVLNDGEEVTAAMLGSLGQLKAAPQPPPAPIAAAPAPASEHAPGERGIAPLWQVERAAIEDAIRICNGNIPRAAALLEVSPSTIYRKRQAWEGGSAG